MTYLEAITNHLKTESGRLEAAASITSLIAVYLVSEQILLEGWLLNLYGDLLWIALGIKLNMPFLIILQLAFVCVCINGLMNIK